MKKIIAILAILTTVASVQANLISRTWVSQLTTAPITGNGVFLSAPELTGDGAGWAYEVWNLTDNVAIMGHDPEAGGVTLGWQGTGVGYLEQGFQFDAYEGKEVALRIYNNTVKPTIPYGNNDYYLQSVSQVLADLDEGTPPGATDLNVQFNFAGQTWTQIPEPATFSLIGLVGLGMIVARRRALRKSSNL